MRYENIKQQWAQRREVIRRWHKDGQSIRSIAVKLKLSTQRIHQIVGGKNGKAQD